MLASLLRVAKRSPRSGPSSLLRRPYLRGLCKSASLGGSTPTDSDDGSTELETLVTASLREVISKGWTDEAIRAATETLGWSPAAAGMLRGGSGELATRFVARSNVALARELAVGKENDADRVVTAVRTRLEMVAPYKHNWASAMALMSRPTHVREAVRQSALLADEIAHYAGLATPAFKWYADRAVLAAMYHSTELFWLTDSSPDSANTWAFLESNVERAQRLKVGASRAVTSTVTAKNLLGASMSAVFRSMRRSY